MTHPKRKKPLQKQPPAGSTSDAVDDIELPPNPSAEEKLDAGVQETFPASDPVSIAQPSETAYEREKRLKRGRTR